MGFVVGRFCFMVRFLVGFFVFGFDGSRVCLDSCSVFSGSRCEDLGTDGYVACVGIVGNGSYEGFYFFIL